MDQNIEQGTKTIAQFMGWYTSPYPNLPDKMYRDSEGEEVGIHIDQFKYHIDWGKLMHAWFTFQKKYDALDRPNKIDNSKFWGDFKAGILNESILISFQALVVGIEWYNEYIKTHNQ